MARKIVGEDGRVYKEKKRGGCLKWAFILLGIAIIGGMFGKPKDDDNGTAQPVMQSTTTTEETTTTKEKTTTTKEETTTTKEITTTTLSREEEIAMIKEEDHKLLTWEQLMRNPDDFMYSQVQISGEALTVQNESDSTYIQLMQDGNSDTPVIIEIPKADLDQNVLKGDWITIYGTYMQTVSYETVLGANVEAPYIFADLIEFK